MEESQELALTQMRKSVVQLGSSTEVLKKYGHPTLMRFLVARSMDPEKAAKMFVQWQKWRASFVPDGFIPESEVQDELATRKIFVQSSFRTGHPLLIVKASRHFPAKDQPQFKKFVVHLLDKTIASSFKGREIGDEKLVGILDLQHIGYKNIDARGLITGFQFLQSYYPERLAKCYILHMPWFFVSVWKMVSYFLERATLEKMIPNEEIIRILSRCHDNELILIVIVSNEREREDFEEEVGEEALPEEYGGRAKLVPLQEVVLPQLEN